MRRDELSHVCVSASFFPASPGEILVTVAEFLHVALQALAGEPDRQLLRVPHDEVLHQLVGSTVDFHERSFATWPSWKLSRRLVFIGE